MNLSLLLKLVKRNKLFFVVSLGALLAVIIFLLGSVPASAIITILIVMEVALALSLGYAQVQRVGIELVTVIAVLTGFFYGPVAGLIIGLLLAPLHFILSQSFGPYLFYSVIFFGVVGFLAGSFSGMDIVLLGIVLSLFYNIVTASIGTFLFQNIAGEMLWSGSNFALNFFLFYKIVPILITYMR